MGAANSHHWRANRALAHFDGTLYGVRNPALWLSPLTTQARSFGIDGGECVDALKIKNAIARER